MAETEHRNKARSTFKAVSVQQTCQAVSVAKSNGCRSLFKAKTEAKCLEKNEAEEIPLFPALTALQRHCCAAD